MSRIGKKIIEIPNGVEIKIDGDLVLVKGSRGELKHSLPACAKLIVEGNQARVEVDNPEDINQNMLWGTNSSIVHNMVKGVTEGFSKQLEINGVGYKASVSGQKLILNIGFSHPVEFEIPKEIKVEVDKNQIAVSGIDKQQVGQVAAQIRSKRPPEPYKGKGIKYADEHIRRKVGKAAAGSEG